MNRSCGIALTTTALVGLLAAACSAVSSPGDTGREPAPGSAVGPDAGPAPRAPTVVHLDTRSGSRIRDVTLLCDGTAVLISLRWRMESLDLHDLMSGERLESRVFMSVNRVVAVPERGVVVALDSLRRLTTFSLPGVDAVQDLEMDYRRFYFSSANFLRGASTDDHVYVVARQNLASVDVRDLSLSRDWKLPLSVRAAALVPETEELVLIDDVRDSGLPPIDRAVPLVPGPFHLVRWDLRSDEELRREELTFRPGWQVGVAGGRAWIPVDRFGGKFVELSLTGASRPVVHDLGVRATVDVATDAEGSLVAVVGTVASGLVRVLLLDVRDGGRREIGRIDVTRDVGMPVAVRVTATPHPTVVVVGEDAMAFVVHFLDK